MNEELSRLEAELEKVRECGLEYLPEYGFASRDDLIQLIKEDIKELRSEMECSREDYAPGELEEERTRLCILQGIARYC